MSLTPWSAVALFAALILSVSLYGLAVSGHFPSEHRGPNLRDGIGKSVLWGTMLIVSASAIWAMVFAVRHLPWYATIIVAGASLLATPVLLRPMPDRFVNGRRGLVIFAAAAAILSGLAWQLAV